MIGEATLAGYDFELLRFFVHYARAPYRYSPVRKIATAFTGACREAPVDV